jgi:hypothetical protein
MRNIVLIIFFICLSLSGLCETIIFKSGKVERADIIKKTDEYIKVDFQGIPITYYFDDITTIDGIAPGRDQDLEGGATFNKKLSESKIYQLSDAAIRFAAPIGWEASVDEGTKGLIFSLPETENFGGLTIFTLPYAFENESDQSILLDLTELAKNTPNAEVKIIDFAGTSAVETFTSDGAYMKEIRFVKDGVMYTIGTMLDIALAKKWAGIIDESFLTFEIIPFSENKETADSDRGMVFSLQKQRSIALENSAGSALHMIVSSQYMYRQKNSKYASLGELGSSNPPYIDATLASGKKQGYIYKAVAGENEFYVTAQPQGNDESLQASFYIDEEGMLCKSIGPNPNAPGKHSTGGCPAGFAQLR